MSETTNTPLIPKDRRPVMLLIIDALNKTRGNPDIAFRNRLANVNETGGSDALIFRMTDGSKFKVSVEAC